MKRQMLSLLLVSTVVLLAFQNCGPAPVSVTGSGIGSSQEVVVGSTKNISKVTYDPDLEVSPNALVKPLLTVDTSTGQMSIRSGQGSVKSCALDSGRLAAIDQILENGKVCAPGTLPPNTAVCMAIGLADVKLEGADVSVYLRPEICNNGAFLCSGQDAQFRAALADIITNPPVACN